MTDVEILRMKLNLADCALDNKGKEDFLAKTDNFHDVFSLRDEIGTCPFIEVHLKLKDETPFWHLLPRQNFGGILCLGKTCVATSIAWQHDPPSTTCTYLTITFHRS